MSKDKTPKCYWCDNDAEGIDYREFDGGVVSKIPSCRVCTDKNNEFHYRLDDKEKVKILTNDLRWMYFFADTVKKENPELYNQACKHADDKTPDDEKE